jgi:hypothetical protein
MNTNDLLINDVKKIEKSLLFIRNHDNNILGENTKYPNLTFSQIYYNHTSYIDFISSLSKIKNSNLKLFKKYIDLKKSYIN